MTTPDEEGEGHVNDGVKRLPGLRVEEPGSPHGSRGPQPVSVSMVAVLMMAPAAVEIVGFVEMAGESPMRGDGPGVGLLTLPFLFCLGLPMAFLGTLFGVVPTLSVAAWAGRRCAGRHVEWWIPAVAGCWAAAVALWPAVVGDGLETWLWVWLSGTAALSAVTLLTRWALTRGRPYGTVVGVGLLSAVAVVAVGSLAYGTGLVDEYAPPRVHASELVGTWNDGRGGTLRLDGEGRAVATGTWSGGGVDSPDGRCEGSGTWRFAPDDDPWLQSVTVEVGDCWSGEWTLSGTGGHPKLNYQLGDTDSPEWYVLTR
ncbi:hypothetical protein ACFYY3_05875 [Streptomyces sp. NPDC001812]|uniref:hypothetical protein n=1 Tax=Streptomyces sp. NPDC001812 TaxID=3364611 RepID=UPI0036AFB746